MRTCFHKFGKGPIVAPWTKVANISAYLGEYTTRNLSMDITLYYQLRIIMGEGGHVIMQARTWPGAAKDDQNDYWRGLVPDTSFVQVFHTQPDLLRDRLKIPVQHSQHSGSHMCECRRASPLCSVPASRAT